MALIEITWKALATKMRLTLARLLLGPAANTDALALDQDARLALTQREREQVAAAIRAGKTLGPPHLTVISGGLDPAGSEKPARHLANIAIAKSPPHQSKFG